MSIEKPIVQHKPTYIWTLFMAESIPWTAGDRMKVDILWIKVFWLRVWYLSHTDGQCTRQGSYRRTMKHRLAWTEADTCHHSDMAHQHMAMTAQLAQDWCCLLLWGVWTHQRVQQCPPDCPSARKTWNTHNLFYIKQTLKRGLQLESV